jgi:hypothetical protein
MKHAADILGDQMPWWEFALLGAGGGVVVEALAVFRWVAAWQDARRGKTGTLRSRPPKLGRYVDFPAHAIMLPARAGLGATAAILFGLTGQITGPYGALAFGCAAPVLLARVGLIPQVGKAIDLPVELTRTNGVRKATDDPSETVIVPEEGSAL